MGKKQRDTHSTFLGVDLARICLYSQGRERIIDRELLPRRQCPHQGAFSACSILLFTLQAELWGSYSWPGEQYGLAKQVLEQVLHPKSGR